MAKFSSFKTENSLQDSNVACVSLWPGAVKTQLIQAAMNDQQSGYADSRVSLSHSLKRVMENINLTEDHSLLGDWFVTNDRGVFQLGRMFASGETIEYSGKGVVALATDAKVSQTFLLTCDSMLCKHRNLLTNGRFFHWFGASEDRSFAGDAQVGPGAAHARPRRRVRIRRH